MTTAVDMAVKAEADSVIGIGGGSAVDTAKAIGILAPSGANPLDHLEVVGKGLPMPTKTIPVIAVSTTAGTGAEVTANTPIFSPEHHVKASLRSPLMLPAVALVDPELTLTCPPAVTASSGLDALCQNLEPYTSCKATTLTNLLAEEGLRRAGTGLRAAYLDGSNVQARTDMSLCSLLGGMSLANAKLGSVHGLAAPLGGMLGAPHGMICAAVLPACTRVNIAALQEREPKNPALRAYEKAMKLLTGNEAATLDEGIAWLEETVSMLNVSGLADMGMTDDMVAKAAFEGLRASSMKGNPLELTQAEVEEILRQSM